MNSKNRKYHIYEKIFDFFQKKNNIFLLVHVNNMSNFESKIISSYCILNNIYGLNVKANLYKKFFKNIIFLDILSGPTKIFSFENFSSFLSFFKNISIKKIFIPLLIFWNNSFYNYKYFFDYISFFFLKRLTLLNNLKQNNKLHYIWFLNYTRKNFIFNFIKFLNMKIVLKKKIVDEITITFKLFFLSNYLCLFSLDTNYYKNITFKTFFLTANILNKKMIRSFRSNVYVNYYENNIQNKIALGSSSNKSIVKSSINLSHINYYENKYI